MWTVSTSLVFLTVSKNFSPRYFHITGFGFITLLIISLYAVLSYFSRQKQKMISVVLLSILCLSGISRYVNHKNISNKVNSTRKIILNNIENINFPENSQIVIIEQFVRADLKSWPNDKILRIWPNGRGLRVWPIGKGYFSYITKRPDISGLFGPEVFNHNPFEKVKDDGGWSNVMSGLSPKNPLFIFRENPDSDQFIQMEYFLQWIKKENSSVWNLYEADKKTGKIKKLKTGIGMKQYDLMIKKMNLEPSKIVWGNVNANENPKFIEL